MPDAMPPRVHPFGPQPAELTTIPLNSAAMAHLGRNNRHLFEVASFIEVCGVQGRFHRLFLRHGFGLGLFAEEDAAPDTVLVDHVLLMRQLEPSECDGLAVPVLGSDDAHIASADVRRHLRLLAFAKQIEKGTGFKVSDVIAPTAVVH